MHHLKRADMASSNPIDMINVDTLKNLREIRVVQPAQSSTDLRAPDGGALGSGKERGEEKTKWSGKEEEKANPSEPVPLWG